jgi:small subunit ribosomal protein S16
MATKIRLARHGRKRYAYYHIVVADSRSPRNGRIIERIGSYNPNNHPASIDLDFDKAVSWLMTGAEPTDTVRSILSREGVLYMKHLLGGVKKGAFDQAEAETRFKAYQEAKDADKKSIVEKLNLEAEAEAKARLEAEEAINTARVDAIQARKSELAAEAEAAVLAAAKEAEAAIAEVEGTKAPEAAEVEETKE